jgi:hypothetical protein
MACILQVCVFARDTDDEVADTRRTRGRHARTVKARICVVYARLTELMDALPESWAARAGARRHP